MAAHQRSVSWKPVVQAGLVAGGLDITYACLFWALKSGTPVSRILQSVAAGLLGRRAFEGGSATAALGLTLHFGIALAMAVAYAAAARRWPLLAQRPWHLGPLYGLALYGVMNYVVVPLSAAGPGPRDPLWVGLSIAIHMVCVGLPIALGTRRALTR
jgi:uncharacterized membrane protein YagU involved in acid resistance